jgi:hypothetical protein
MKRIASLVVLLCSILCTERAAANCAEPGHWRSIAKRDLEAAHRLILDAHPGSIDKGNPAFLNWVERGYTEAMDLISKIRCYEDALSVVRYYFTGFQDGHLLYSDDIRPKPEVQTLGWFLANRSRGPTVVATIRNWPISLPPKNSVLLGCDGKNVDVLLRDEVAPYYDRRELAASRDAVIFDLSVRNVANASWRNCKWRTKEGSEIDIPVGTHATPFEEVFNASRVAIGAQPERKNAYRVVGETLWIRAGNFSLQESDVKDLDRILAEIRQLHGYKNIVFDARGNGGGDSGVGSKIFDEVTGGLTYDKTDIDTLPRTFAQWRVSDTSISAIRTRIDKMTQLYGAMSDRAVEAQIFLSRLEAARTKGQAWVEQPDSDFLVTPEEVIRRHGRLKGFSGRLAVVTDSSCASACLDFVDQIRLVPGAIHVGQQTSADAVYIDIGIAQLPSGNKMSMPLKVWRNRLRANNEPWVPQVPFDFDIRDDERVELATLAAFRN